jgi:hypothetical protein
VLGVRYPQSGVQEVLQNQQLYLIFSLKSSFCASFLPSNKDSNPHSSIFTYKNHQNHRTNLQSHHLCVISKLKCPHTPHRVFSSSDSSQDINIFK